MTLAFPFFVSCASSPLLCVPCFVFPFSVVLIRPCASSPFHVSFLRVPCFISLTAFPLLRVSFLRVPLLHFCTSFPLLRVSFLRVPCFVSRSLCILFDVLGLYVPSSCRLILASCFLSHCLCFLCLASSSILRFPLSRVLCFSVSCFVFLSPCPLLFIAAWRLFLGKTSSSRFVCVPFSPSLRAVRSFPSVLAFLSRLF